MKKIVYTIAFVAITSCVAWSQNKIAILEPVVQEGNVTIGQQAILRSTFNKSFYGSEYEVILDKRLEELSGSMDFSKEVVDGEVCGKYKDIVDVICQPFLIEKGSVLYMGLYWIDAATGQKMTIEAVRTNTESMKKVQSTCSTLLTRVKYGKNENNLVGKSSYGMGNSVNSSETDEYTYSQQNVMVEEKVKCRGRVLYDENGVLSEEQVYDYLQDAYQDWDDASKKRNTGIILMGTGYGLAVAGFTTSLVLLGTGSGIAGSMVSLVATVGVVMGVIGTPMFVIANKRVNEIMRSSAYRQSNYQTTATLTFGQQTNGIGFGLRF